MLQLTLVLNKLRKKLKHHKGIYMIILFSNKNKEDLTSGLAEYEKAVLEVTAYSTAILKAKSPRELDLPEKEKSAALICFNNAVLHSNNWIGVIVKHCRVIPQTIIGYNYLFNLNIEQLKQGLAELAKDPDNKSLKDSLAHTFGNISQATAAFASDSQKLTGNIKTFFTDVKGDNENFKNMIEVVKKTIKADEKELQEIVQKLGEAEKALAKAESRLKEDELLMNNKAFIIMGIIFLGIPLLIVTINETLAKKEIAAQTKLVEACKAGMASETLAIASLNAAQICYEGLCGRIESLLKSSNIIVKIWEDFSAQCDSFLKVISDAGTEFNQALIKEALEAIGSMEKNWESLYNVALSLSKVNYEVVEMKAAA